MTEVWTLLGRTFTTAYTWTNGDRLASVTYPSGRTVAFSRNTLQQIGSVSSNGVTVLSGRSYRGDGLLTGQTTGNGVVESRSYDTLGRMTGWNVGSSLAATFAFDANSNMTSSLLNAASSGFGYDSLDRLISEPGQSFTYDANGNRLSDMVGSFTYENNSNRLATTPFGAVSLDAAGNIVGAWSGWSFTYTGAGQLATGTNGVNSVAYAYREDGQRSSKTVTGVTTTFHYDVLGRLIAESDSTGSFAKEYLWDC